MQTSKNILSNSTAGTSTLAEERSFDAWGRLRNPTNWSYTLGTTGVSTGKLSLTNRGYTGHEHLPAYNIINMNGRVYDPVVARFLSADDKNIIPISTQHFNRYSYVLNNPLKYTDPSGWEEEPVTNLPEVEIKAKRNINAWFEKFYADMRQFDIQQWGKTVFGPIADDNAMGVNTNKRQEQFSQQAWNKMQTMVPAMKTVMTIAGTVVDKDMEFNEDGEMGELDEEDYFDAAMGAMPGGGQANSGIKAGVQMGLKPAENYVLRAAKDGMYPLLKRGKGEVGKIWLKAGEAWKYGISQNPKYRYTKAYLDRIGVVMNRDYKPKLRSIARQIETNNIVKYFKKHGYLPGGNKQSN